MSAVEAGLTYRLLPVPGGLSTVDGIVTVLQVGGIGPREWATVTGRGEVPVEELEEFEEPGLVEDTVWITLVSRLGEPVRQAVA